MATLPRSAPTAMLPSSGDAVEGGGGCSVGGGDVATATSGAVLLTGEAAVAARTARRASVFSPEAGGRLGNAAGALWETPATRAGTGMEPTL